MCRAVRVAQASLPLWAPAALALLAAGEAGCGGCRGKSQDRAFERELAAQLARQLGPVAAGAQVRCSWEREEPEHCAATVAGQALPIALRREGDQLSWQLEGLVISGRELEQQLTAELTDLGLAAKPSCGPPLQPVVAGERVTCSLSELGVAWATVRADGSYSWELALGEAQAERSQQLEEAQLDLLSRALDRAAGAEGEDGDDDDAAADDEAGSASAPPGSAPPGSAPR